MKNNLINLISNTTNFAIFGAQVVAYGAYVAIKHLSGREPECFIVSNHEDNPSEINSIPVKLLDDFNLNKDIFIIAAGTDLILDDICNTLRGSGFKNIQRIDSHEEHLLMSDYYSSIGKFPPAISNADINPEFKLFQVYSHVGKTLKNPPKTNPWEIPVQAGADLTKIRICEMVDNTGDNISSKNKQYCEATAMYWIWKNISSPWVGIEHYRRRLLVGPDMLTDDVDAVLTLPYICYPDSLTQLKRYVDDDVAGALLTALKTLHPDEYDNYASCLSGTYHYAYNLFAAKSNVYSDYCKWAFGITEYMESVNVPVIKETRALSYIVEILTSIYFVTNLNGLNIKHVEKAIYT